MKQFIIGLFLLTIFSIEAGAALGPQRIVYFSQVGRNYVMGSNGLKDQGQSKCRITISNPSSNQENYTLVITASSSSNPTVASLNVTPTINGATTTGSGCNATSGVNTFTCTSTITNTSLVYDVWFAPWAAYPSINAAGSQDVLCKGSITVQDNNSSAPATLTASASLVLFNQASTIQTTGTTGASSFAGFAVYNQVPIAINNGSPF